MDALALLNRLSDEDRAEVLRLLPFVKAPAPTLANYCESTVRFRLRDWQREHFVPILENWVETPGIKVGIHAPPQEGKSWIVSQRLIAYILGKYPEARVRLACYNIRKARQFGRVVLSLMRDPAYMAWAGEGARVPNTASAEEFFTAARAKLNDAQPSFMALGLESGFVGQGADFLIMDDPYASPLDARSETINDNVYSFWRETAVPRIEDECRVLANFHRYHENDLGGRLLAEGDWEYHRFPMIADGNEDGRDPTGRAEGELLSNKRSLETLLSIKERDPQTWLSMFQGVPRPPEGAFFHREWFKTGQRPNLKRFVRFWDLATKADRTGDFTAGALCGVAEDHTFWVLDVVRFRAEWPDACQIIATVTERDFEEAKSRGAIYQAGVEKVAWQRPMIQDLFRLGIFERVQLTPAPAKGDKKERASGWAARGRYDKLRLVPGAWNTDFIQEAVVFDGNGLTHDDQIDAASGAYELLWWMAGGNVPEHKPVAAGSWEYYEKLTKQDNETDDFWED